MPNAALCFPKGVPMPDILNKNLQKQMELQSKMRQDEKIRTCSVCNKQGLGLDGSKTRRYHCPKTNTVTCSLECYKKRETVANQIMQVA